MNKRRSKRRFTGFKALPSRLLSAALHFLGPRELAASQRVCSQWRLPESLKAAALYDLARSSIVMLKAAGDLGHSVALFRLARIYGRCTQEGGAFLQRAATQGHTEAQYELGCVLWGQSRAEAKALFELAAEKGHTGANFEFGFILHQEGDHSRAAKFYQYAVDAGSVEALCNLAMLYQDGQGVPQDLAKAVSMYRSAMEQRSSPAAFNLGLLYDYGAEGLPQDSKMARQLYKQAADYGHLDAMTQLGWMYWAGKGGPRDLKTAAELFEKTAGLGNHRAEAFLGAMFMHGLGVDKNEQKAKTLFDRSAAEGSKCAKTFQAWCHENGLCGYPKDDGRAAQLYTEAGAKTHLARLGLLQEPDVNERLLSDYRWQAELGMPIALSVLGYLYEKGHGGVSQDTRKALELYASAGAQGAVWAQARLLDFALKK